MATNGAKKMNATKTAMAVALKEAKIAPPLNQRVWQWLHDKGGEYGCKAVAEALNAPMGNVSSVLGDMVKRKMILCAKRPVSHKNTGVALSYWANPKMKTYTLLPKAKAKVGTVVPVEPAPTAPAAPVAATPAFNPKDVLASLNVREAFAMYKELHEMFGAKA